MTVDRMHAQAAFRHQFSVRLHDTDAAGVIFYGHLFRHAHDAYEAFMAELGFPLDRVVRDGLWQLPLVHAEADYLGAMRHGDRVTAVVTVARLGRRAFTLAYRFCDPADRTLATARTVHAYIDADTRANSELPPALRTALLSYATPA